MGQCGCSRGDAAPIRRSLRKEDSVESALLNESRRFILERTKAKRGPQGVELGWLNFMVQKLWPKLSKACTAIIKEELQPKLQAAVPAVLSGIYFKKLDFGNQHPLLGPVGVAHGKQNQYDGLELDVKLLWKCNAEVVLEVQGIEIGLEKIRIDGTVRLQLRPLLHHFPSMGGLQITMMSPPNLNWNFRGLLGALQLDVLSRVMRQVVADQISELLVVPNLLFVHWMDSSADVDLEVLQFPHPECIVRLCVREARNLRGSDWNYFGFKGTSDPYVSVHLGSRLWHTPKKTRTRNPKWGDAGLLSMLIAAGSLEFQLRGCEDFFVYTPSQFVKVDVYDADIGPGLLPEERVGVSARNHLSERNRTCAACARGTDDHLGHVAGLKVEDLLNSPSQWWPLSGRKVRDAQPEPGTASQDTSQDHSHPHGEVYIQARFYELRTHRLDVPKPMGKEHAEAFVFIDLRSLRGLQQKQAQGATITFKLEGNTHKSRGATYKATTYGSALTASAQRLVEHLQNSQGKSIEEIMKISGLSKEQVASVVQARPSFTTRWHQPFSFPIRDLDNAQLEISLGIRRPNQKSLAQLKSPICLKDLVDSGKWQLDKALVLDLDGKEGTSVVLETLELSLRITLRSLFLLNQDLSSLEESRLAGWGGQGSQAHGIRRVLCGPRLMPKAPAGWASMDLKEVVLREEHLRLTAQARIETACCTEHALASQLSEMKMLLGRLAAARRIGVSAATPFAKFNARTFAAQVSSPRPLSIRGDGLVLQCITAALIYFVPQDAVFLGGLFYLWHNTAASISPKVPKADADAAVEEFKAKKGIENVKVSKGRSTWTAAAKSSLAKAANWKDEALRHLSKIEKHRREEVRDLLEAETILRRQMQDAEDSSDKCLAELRSEHAHAERRVAREFEECDAALLVRSKAAEELLAAAEKEKSLTRMCALHGLRGEALEARLHVSRQLMVEACQAHEAADRREAVAALARSEARGAEELAVQQAASQGLMESQFLRQSAAERAEQLEEQEATVKARADKAVALVEGEVEALRHGALQCSVSEQAEEFIELARQGLARKSTILEKAEAAVADAWKSEEANIRAMREEQNVEVQEALESAAAAAAIGEELATELGEELRTRLRGVRSEEKQMQHECEKAIEADMHRLRSTECSESEFLAERLHIEEEVLSFEVTEEEAASMLRQQLEQQINEAAEQCKELAKNTSGALQQLRELTQQAEQSTRQAEEAAEQDEKMHRCAAQQSETSAEAAEKLQQRRSLALHEEVLAAKLNAERSIAHDEWLAGEEEEAALAEEDRCIRACCEEIAAARYEAETVISSWRVEDAVLEVDAQELLDKAAELQLEQNAIQLASHSNSHTARFVSSAKPVAWPWSGFDMPARGAGATMGAAMFGKLMWPTGTVLTEDRRGAKLSPEPSADLLPSSGCRPTTFSRRLSPDLVVARPLSSIAGASASNAVELACYWSNSVRPYALRGSPFLRPPVSAALLHFELDLHERGLQGEQDGNSADFVIQTALQGMLELSLVCHRDGQIMSTGTAWCAAAKTMPPFDGVVVPPLPLSPAQADAGGLRWKALQRRQAAQASQRPRTVSAAEAEAGAVVDVPVYSQFHVAPAAHMEQVAGAKTTALPLWRCELRTRAGAIGKPVAMTILPAPSLCADVGPVLIEAVSAVQENLTNRSGRDVQVVSLDAWLSHVPPKARLQIWLCSESGEDDVCRSWVTVWHGKEPLIRMRVESRMLEESRCSEEETCEELVVAADEVRAAARAAVHGYEAREAIAQRTAHELQEEAKQKQEARSLHAGHRFNSAELRAEAAARRALEAEESSWIARQRYEQELASMRVHGEKEEAETIRRVLAAEEALANSMRWSGQHNQLGLELFGVAQAQKGIRRSSPASVANGAPPDSAEADAFVG
eukprot:s1697_g14.t4